MNLDKNMNYSELKHKSEQVAIKLLEQGIGNNVTVAIRMSRTTNLIVAYMAIIRAGGIILPIDEALPESRIQYMLKDSNCSVILTDELIDNIVNNEDIPSCSEIILSPYVVSSSPIAYIMYTSGTTGTPKGVPISYDAFWSFLKNFTKVIKFSSKDIIAAVTTICFDICMVELVLPLLCGMTTLLLPETTINNAYLLIEAIEKYRVTIIQTTPSRMELLLDAGRKKKWYNYIDKMLIGGEDFPISLRDRLFACGEMKVFNVYGPTEATIWVSSTQLKDKEPIDLGNPLPGNNFYVIDDNDNLVEDGREGELCISGAQLTTGYLNNPEQTTIKFRNCRHAKETIYFTGDIVKKVNNRFYYIGRKDEQVKIRGYRIELAEIECHLKNLEDIDNAKVLAAKGKYGSYLIAFYTANCQIEAADISEALKTFLASYMIPSYYVYLDEFPCNINGKIDKKKLLELADVN